MSIVSQVPLAAFASQLTLIGVLLIAVYIAPAEQKQTLRKLVSALVVAIIVATAVYASPIYDMCKTLEPYSVAWYWMGCWW